MWMRLGLAMPKMTFILKQDYRVSKFCDVANANYNYASPLSRSFLTG